MVLLGILYTCIAIFLSLYGAHALLLVLLHWRGCRPTRPQASEVPLPATWPRVTVQLPVYNERYVVARLIDAVAQLDYPLDRLEIQVLDDSTDVTTAIAAKRVEFWQRRGVNIKLVHRANRTGYKAGALQHGLKQATGEFIAIFDADFVPPRDWLRRTVPALLRDERVGVVQTRWEHLNPASSLLTRAQALALDGHFGVEQPARARNGLLLNFNGSAGLWRRACIEDAGGWRGDTLSEDLDLSYRAQLRGWRVVYLPDVVAPAEIPLQMSAFKRQQFRWAKGSAQCVRLLAGQVVRSSLPAWTRVMALFHLTGYFIHVGMMVLLLLTLPLLLWQWPVPAGLPPAWLGLFGMGAPVLYVAAQQALRRDWKRGVCWLPALMVLGVGVACNNARAVLEGLMSTGGEFARTPKLGVRQARGARRVTAYRLPAGGTTWAELVMGGYALVSALVAATQHRWLAVIFLVLYALGFWWVGGMTLWETLWPSRTLRRLRVLRGRHFARHRPAA